MTTHRYTIQVWNYITAVMTGNLNISTNKKSSDEIEQMNFFFQEYMHMHVNFKLVMVALPNHGYTVYKLQLT